MAYIVYSETTRIIDAAFATLVAAAAHVDSHEEELTADNQNRVLPDAFQPGVWHFHADGTIAPDPPAATIQLTLRRDFLLGRCRHWLTLLGMPILAAAEGDKLVAYGLHLEGCVRAVLVDGNLTDDTKHTDVKAELDQDPLAWVRLAIAADWVRDRGTDRSAWEWKRTSSDGGAAEDEHAIGMDGDANWITALL